LALWRFDGWHARVPCSLCCTDLFDKLFAAIKKKKTKRQKKGGKKDMEGTNCYEACINKNCARFSKLLHHAG
jgi:hypothetical protein